MKKALAAFALLVCLAAPAAAQNVILETASYVQDTTDLSSGGVGVFIGRWHYAGDLQYRLLASFHLSTMSTITSVGIANAMLMDTGGRSNDLLYAAIVKVQGNRLPSQYPYNPADVVAATTWTPAGGDQRIPLSATLDPGDYAVLFTAGPENTDGGAWIGTRGQQANGTPFVRVSDDFANGSWTDPTTANWQSGPIRIVIEGAGDHETIVNPVSTRASQASVDAIASTVGALASQAAVNTLSSSIATAFANLSGQVATRASQQDLQTLGGGTNLAAISAALAAKANDASVTALGGQIQSLTTSVSGLQTNLTGVATQSDVNAAALAVSGAVSTRASQASVDALAQTLGSDRSLRLAIEQALAEGRVLVSFYAPASAGGQLDLVREVVSDALAQAAASGVPTAVASKFFARGDAARAAGDYRTAYFHYAAVYQALIH